MTMNWANFGWFCLQVVAVLGISAAISLLAGAIIRWADGEDKS